ncbi:MAG: hypothetical protein R6X02_35895 [Enhygromyxa sp.]
MFISTILILTTLTTGTPNLCDDVYINPATGRPYTDSVGQTLARFCEWTGPDAPIWNADVCCTIDDYGAQCTRPDRKGRCRTGLKLYCKYGDVMRDGSVECYQPLRDMCDLGLCIQQPDLPPPGLASYAGCCSSGGVCQLVTWENTFDCPDGLFVSCYYGHQNQDGTVECYD